MTESPKTVPAETEVPVAPLPEIAPATVPLPEAKPETKADAAK